MLSGRHIFLVAVIVTISVIQVSVPSNIPEVSERAGSVPGSLNNTESFLPSCVLRGLTRAGPTPQTYVKSRRTTPPGHISFKYLIRGPNYEFIPIHVGALALHNFYSSISYLASTIWPRTKSPATVLTITQGALQLTMTGVGTAVPWDFVEDWAIRAAESVARGWTDTFDAGYEVEGTGTKVWISLRLLEGLLGGDDAMDAAW